MRITDVEQSSIGDVVIIMSRGFRDELNLYQCCVVQTGLRRVVSACSYGNAKLNKDEGMIAQCTLR